MKHFLIQYIDHEDQDTNKEEILRGLDTDDVECNLFRKTKCNNFTVLNIIEMSDQMRWY